MMPSPFAPIPGATPQVSPFGQPMGGTRVGAPAPAPAVAKPLGYNVGDYASVDSKMGSSVAAMPLWRQQLDYLKGIGGLAGRDTGQQFRTAQLGLMKQLQHVSDGSQQGAGELAVQRQVANALAGQQAQAAMARGGGNAALAGRQAMRNQAGIGLAGAGQAQQAAMGDVQAAQGLLGQLAGQGRQGDLNQMNTNDAAINAYLQQMGALNQSYMNNYTQRMGIDAQPGTAERLLGSLLNAGGQIGSAAAGKPPTK